MRILIKDNQELYMMLKSYIYMLPIGSCITDQLPDLDTYKDFDIIVEGTQIVKGKDDDYKSNASRI